MPAIIPGVIAHGRRKGQQSLPPDIPVYEDPNWDDVVYLLDQDWPSGGTRCQNNRLTTPVGLRGLLHVDEVVKPSHLARSFHTVTATNQGIVVIDDPGGLFILGSEQFTIEGWVYTSPFSINGSMAAMFSDWDRQRTDNSYLFGTTFGSAGLLPSRRILFLFWPDGQTLDDDLASPQFPENTWVYAAVDRDEAGFIRLYVNGQMVAKKHVPQLFTPSQPGPAFCKSGSLDMSSAVGPHYGMRVAECRFTRGRALYASDAGHVVPMNPHPVGKDGTGDPFWRDVTILHRFYHTSSEVKRGHGFNNPSAGIQISQDEEVEIYPVGTVRNTSTSTLASGAYHTTDPEPFDMKGLVPFTVEGFIRADFYMDRADIRGIVGLYRGTNGHRQWTLVTTQDQLRLLASTNGLAAQVSEQMSTKLPLGQVLHVALSRDQAGVFRVFLDGQMVLKSDALAGLPLHDAIASGRGSADILQYSSSTVNTSNSVGFCGALDELRITRGVCRYPSDFGFTPPQGPFPGWRYIAPTYVEPQQEEIVLNRNYFDGSYVNLQSEWATLPFQKDGSVDFGDGYTIYLVNTLESGMLQFQTEHGQNVVLNNARGFLNSGETARARLVGYIGAGDEREAVWEIV